MKKFIFFSFFLPVAILFFPMVASADVTFTPDLKTIGCYNVNDGNVSWDGGGATTLSISFSDTGNANPSTWNTTGTSGNIDLSTGGDAPFTYPKTVEEYGYYQGGWSTGHTLTNPLTLQETSCISPVASTTIEATSTIEQTQQNLGWTFVVFVSGLLFALKIAK